MMTQRQSIWQTMWQ